MVFITLGTDNAFVRFFNKYSFDDRKALLRAVLKGPLLFFAFIACISLVLYRPISFALIGSYDLAVVFLLILTVLSDLLFRFSLLVLRMQKKATMYSIVQIAHKMVYLVIMLFLFWVFGDTYGAILMSFSFSISIACALAIIADYKFWTQSNSTSSIDSVEIFKYSIPFMISSTMTVLNENTDKLLIKVFLSNSELGIYSAGFKLVSVLSIFQGMIATILVPLFYEHYEKEESDKRYYKDAFNLVSLIMILIAIGFIFFKDILIFLLGSEYREVVSIIPFFVFGPLMYTVSETTVIGINFMKKSHYHIFIALGVLLISSLSNLILIPLLGLIGSGISYALASVSFFVLRSLFAFKSYKIKYNYGRFFILTTFLVLYLLYMNNRSIDYITTLVTLFFIVTTLGLYKTDITNMLKKIF